MWNSWNFYLFVVFFSNLEEQYFVFVIDTEIVKKSVSFKMHFFLSFSRLFWSHTHDDVVIDEAVSTSVTDVTPLLPLTVEPLLPLTVLDRFIGGWASPLLKDSSLLPKFILEPSLLMSASESIGSEGRRFPEEAVADEVKGEDDSVWLSPFSTTVRSGELTGAGRGRSTFSLCRSEGGRYWDRALRLR